MSYTAVESIHLNKKAELRKQQKLDKEIDVDVQKLREIADNLVLSGSMDSKGYYAFTVKPKDFQYKHPKVILERFITHMESLGFIVPKIAASTSFFFKKHTSYVIRFRPSEQAMAAAATAVSASGSSDEDDSSDDEPE